LFAIIALCLLAVPAAAQTRIALDAGLLMPIGDMSDVHKASPLVGAKWEYQSTNALGNISTRTWFLRFGYGFLQKKDLPGLDENADDGHYLDLTIGGRAYAKSKFSPFFMSVAAGYAQYDLPGDRDALNGGTVNGGLGLRFGTVGFVIEAEARFHLGFFEESTDIQYFSGIVSLGIPL
jgi:hypothetical protein